MSERRILPVVVVVLVALLVLVIGLWSTEAARQSTPATQAQSLSSDVFEWKLVTTWPKNLPGLGSAPENFARWVNEMSGGRLKVDVYGAGELVPAFEVFDAVSQGVAQVGHGASYYWKGKVPAAIFLRPCLLV